MEIEQVVKLIQTVSDSALTGFRYEAEGICLSLEKESIKEVGREVQTYVQTDSAAVMKDEKKEQSETVKPGRMITSMLVGTFYAAPAENADPYVTLGDVIRKGQTVGIIEAMKLMNEVESEYDGKILEVLVQNGETVEYGQPLFRVSAE